MLLIFAQNTGILEPMGSKRTAEKPAKPAGIRAIARAQMNQEIKRIAWDQLQKDGANNLSLRAISREMGMTSSALYRYFNNRDALLTALIIDAYNDVGERVEHNNSQIPAENYRQRFISIGQTIMAWGKENPHRFALVYGPAIPGYAAPEDTVDPGTRSQLVLYRLMSEWSDTQDIDHTIDAPPVPPKLGDPLQAAAAEVGMHAPTHQIMAGLALWSELMGVIYSHFFNHFGRELTDEGNIGSWLIERMATRIFGPEH